MPGDTPEPKLPSWRAMHADTDPRIEAMQFRFYREAPAWRKCVMVGEMNKGMKLLALAGLQSRFPDASPVEIQRRPLFQGHPKTHFLHTSKCKIFSLKSP